MKSDVRKIVALRTYASDASLVDGASKIKAPKPTKQPTSRPTTKPTISPATKNSTTAASQTTSHLHRQPPASKSDSPLKNSKVTRSPQSEAVEIPPFHAIRATSPEESHITKTDSKTKPKLKPATPPVSSTRPSYLKKDIGTIIEDRPLAPQSTIESLDTTGTVVSDTQTAKSGFWSALKEWLGFSNKPKTEEAKKPKPIKPPVQTVTSNHYDKTALPVHVDKVTDTPDIKPLKENNQKPHWDNYIENTTTTTPVETKPSSQTSAVVDESEQPTSDTLASEQIGFSTNVQTHQPPTASERVSSTKLIPETPAKTQPTVTNSPTPTAPHWDSQFDEAKPVSTSTPHSTTEPALEPNVEQIQPITQTTPAADPKPVEADPKPVATATYEPEPPEPPIEVTPKPTIDTNEETGIEPERPTTPLVQPTVKQPGTNRLPILAMVIVSIVVLVGLGGWYQLRHIDWPIWGQQSVTPANEITTINTNQTIQLPVDDQSSVLSSVQAAAKTAGAGITGITLISNNQPLTLADKASALDLNVQSSFGRNITNIEFGSVGSLPYIAIEFIDYDIALSGMLEWEASITTSLESLFGTVATDQTFTDVTAPIEANVIRAGSGRTNVVYALIGNTILIAPSVEVIRQLSSRLK